MRRLTCLFGTLIFLLPELAFSHHGNATNRPSASADSNQAYQSYRSKIELRYQLSYFAKTLEDDSKYAQKGLGRILNNKLSLKGVWATMGGSFLEVQVPVLASRISPEEGEAKNQVGLSDVTLGIGQMTRFSVGERKLSLAGNLGASLPTGEYQSESLLSKTDISAGQNGQIDVGTFNMNTSLGSGVYSFLLGANMGFRFSEKLAGNISQSISVPLTRTPDDIAWGVDSTSSIGARIEIAPKTFGLSASLNYAIHTQDEVEDAELPGSYRDVGGRDQLSFGLGANLRLSKFNCSLSTSLPVYQKVGGIQLVESFNGHLGCGFAL